MMLTIAGVAAAAAIINAVLPTLSRSSGAVITSSAKVDDRLKTDIEIVHIVGELDASGVFQDTNGDGLFDIFIWVKNVGQTRISSINQTDVFLGTIGNFPRIPHESELQSGEYPRWSYILEGGATEWGPKNTLKITSTWNSTQDAGNYDVKVIIPNGVTDEQFFSM